MAKLFFLLSGEHPTLPFSELTSILEAQNYGFRILEKLTQVLRVECDVGSVESIESRASMTRICCLELFDCKTVFAEILDKMHSASLKGLIASGQSFEVRVRRIRGVVPELASVELERKLGEMILKKVRGTKVSLKAPQKRFFGILTDNSFLFGLKVGEISPKSFVERRPRKRPFFHPSAMPAKLARCMVNLARPKTGDLVLDPFCGTASFLVEAWLIGCRVVGFDVQPRMMKGSLKNLLHYGVEPHAIAVADARHPPVTKVDCVVTDPPYGRSATTLGRSTRRIVEEFLPAARDILRQGSRICMASPKSVRLCKIGKKLGFKHLESHFVHVHRSLTREIVVFERP